MIDFNYGKLIIHLVAFSRPISVDSSHTSSTPDPAIDDTDVAVVFTYKSTQFFTLLMLFDSANGNLARTYSIYEYWNQ